MINVAEQTPLLSRAICLHTVELCSTSSASMMTPRLALAQIPRQTSSRGVDVNRLSLVLLRSHFRLLRSHLPRLKSKQELVVWHLRLRFPLHHHHHPH